MSFSNRASNRSIRFHGGESSIGPNPKPEKSIFCGMSDKGVCISKSLNLGDGFFVDIYRRSNDKGTRFYLHNKGESLTSFRYDSDYNPSMLPSPKYKYEMAIVPSGHTTLVHYPNGNMAICESVGLRAFWYVGKDKMFVPDRRKCIRSHSFFHSLARSLPQQPEKEPPLNEPSNERLKAVASHISDYHRVASLIDQLEECLTGGSSSEIVVKNKEITKVKFEYSTE